MVVVGRGKGGGGGWVGWGRCIGVVGWLGWFTYFVMMPVVLTPSVRWVTRNLPAALMGA
jgi:hypothetical protein